MTKEHRILARHLCSYITDRSTVTAHVNRQFGTRYKVADIDAMVARREIDGIPRGTRKTPIDDPIAWTPALSTARGGMDPLAAATNAYLAKHGDSIRKALAA